MKRYSGRRKNGTRSGYGDYRYGPENTAPITLAGQRRPAPTFRGEKRKHLVDEVIDRLGGWRLTPFEREADLRNGLRSALCGEGFSFARSEGEADAVVAEGLRRIGAERPTWEQGQWHHSGGRDYCARCFRPMEESDHGQRFCTVECAKAFRAMRFEQERETSEAIDQAAYVLIARKTRPSVDCQECGKAFWPRDRSAKFCSPKCVRAQGLTLTDINCMECGTAFHPADRNKKFCCVPCSSRHISRMRGERRGKQCCVMCQEEFMPLNASMAYCSERCKLAKRNEAKRIERATARQVEALRTFLDGIDPAPRRLTAARLDRLLGVA